jgi:hypothetical protein
MKWLRREWWVLVLIASVIAFGAFFWWAAGTHARLTFRRFANVAGKEVAIFVLENRSTHLIKYAPDQTRFSQVFGPQCTDGDRDLFSSEEAEIIVPADLSRPAEHGVSYSCTATVTKSDRYEDNLLPRLQQWLPSWIPLDGSLILRARVVKP